ncbi:MAG TPA: alkaline phosphatase family protein, partial [Candidatus Polarisedimenticolia bacterium]|nr:alkaline phosphatase family protein [Candidatus Polarisedimenticolia bacterium]
MTARFPGGLLLLVVAILVAGCARGGPAETSPAPGGAGSDRPPRVILFGIDGADWALINPLIDQGRLPNLQSMVREGASGTLLSMEPSASPSLWTTIATGVGPDRHGIRNFVVPVGGPAGGPPPGVEEAAWGGTAVKPVTSTMRQAPAFWNILGKYEKRVGVVGWLVTWPAEPVNGFIVSTYLPYVYNWSTGRPLKGTLVEGIPHQTFPEGLVDEVAPYKVRPEDIDAGTLSRYYDPAAVERLQPADQECVTGFRWSLACDETYRRIGRHLFARYPVDLFAVYFGGVDVASHRFWKFAHPDAMDYRVPRQDIPILAGVIDAYYQHVDEALG